MPTEQPSSEKGRKGGRYTKTPLSLKIALLRAVFQLGQPIKKVSETLKIKYSTAKTLARQYKLNQECIEWEDYSKELPQPIAISSALKRCHFVQIEQSEPKTESREAQTDAINGLWVPSQKFEIEQNHIQKGVCFRRIEIISRTVDDSLGLKAGGAAK